MKSCLEALRILELKKKKTVSWDKNSERESWDSSVEEGRPVGVYEMCRVFVEEIVSLSLLMSKNLKLKTVNKSWTNFVFFGFPMSISHVCYWSYILGPIYVTVIDERIGRVM